MAIGIQSDSTLELTPWRSLTAFSAYRLFLAATLFVVYQLGLPPGFLGKSNPGLYVLVTQFYLLSAAAILVFTIKRLGRFETQVKLQLSLDIVVITLVMNASGGLATGLGSLLVVVVVAGSALMPGRMSAFFAALATFAVLLEASFSQVFGDAATKYSYAGLLGASFFATTLLTQLLSQKIESSLVLAEKRAEDLANLAMLNEHIISQMETGVLVLNNSNHIRLSNDAARTMLGIEPITVGVAEPLKYWLPTLDQQILAWKKNHIPFEPYQARADLPEVLINAIAMGSGETVLYINDTSAVSQQAQQLKLASLGQLTASIAHQVRNPLGAISHAGELLAEVHEDNNETQKLTDIIQRHSERVNTIIETILEMSRQKSIQPKRIELAKWLNQFINEFCEYRQIEAKDIVLENNSRDAKILIDPEQLHQVLVNIMENAWYYSVAGVKSSRVKVRVMKADDNIVLDVIDNGPGVSDEMQEKLFEPFQSERQGGTGLGLYLARELCKANGVRLSYLPDEKGSCFRMVFSNITGGLGGRK